MSGERRLADLEALRKELEKVQTVAELDRRLAEAGGIELDEDLFGLFCEEYRRRGWRLPA